MPRIRALILLTLLAGCATQVPSDAPLQVLVPVLYATNRSPSAAEDGGAHRLGELGVPIGSLE